MNKRWHIYMFLSFSFAEVTIVYKTNASQTEQERKGRAAFERLKKIKFTQIKGCKDNPDSVECCNIQRKIVAEMLKDIRYTPLHDIADLSINTRYQDTAVYEVSIYYVLKHLFYTKNYQYEEAKAAGVQDSVFINLENHIIRNLRATEPFDEPEKKNGIFTKIGKFLKEERAPKPPPEHGTIEKLLPSYSHHYQKGPLKHHKTQKIVQKPPPPLPLPSPSPPPMPIAEETISQHLENEIQEPVIIHIEKQNKRNSGLRNTALVLFTSFGWYLYYSRPATPKGRKQTKRNHRRILSKMNEHRAQPPSTLVERQAL